VFLRYDDNLHWYDGSKEFRSASLGTLTQYTSKLIDEGKWLHLIALLEASFREPEVRNDYLLQYHYAFALHNCGRVSDAIAAYSRSIALQPAFYYTLLHRGNAFRQNGDLASACNDYRRAAATEGAYADVKDLLRQHCK
jgi:tetratricopeptide (TPR) repeat protein